MKSVTTPKLNNHSSLRLTTSESDDNKQPTMVILVSVVRHVRLCCNSSQVGVLLINYYGTRQLHGTQLQLYFTKQLDNTNHDGILRFHRLIPLFYKGDKVDLDNRSLLARGVILCASGVDARRCRRPIPFDRTLHNFHTTSRKYRRMRAFHSTGNAFTEILSP